MLEQGGQQSLQSNVQHLQKVCFADFDVLKLLGEGSFGRVYKVKKRDTGQMFAMKSMKKSFLI